MAFKYGSLIALFCPVVFNTRSRQHGSTRLLKEAKGEAKICLTRACPSRLLLGILFLNEPKIVQTIKPLDRRHRRNTLRVAVWRPELLDVGQMGGVRRWLSLTMRDIRGSKQI